MTDKRHCDLCDRAFVAISPGRSPLKVAVTSESGAMIRMEMTCEHPGKHLCPGCLQTALSAGQVLCLPL